MATLKVQSQWVKAINIANEAVLEENRRLKKKNIKLLRQNLELLEQIKDLKQTVFDQVNERSESALRLHLLRVQMKNVGTYVYRWGRTRS